MTGPAYDAADLAAVLFVSVATLLLIAAVYIVGLYVAHGPSLADDLDDVDTCEDCSRVLTEHNRAVTCAVHQLCDDCDAHRVDSCRSCLVERIEVSS